MIYSILLLKQEEIVISRCLLGLPMLVLLSLTTDIEIEYIIVHISFFIK